MPTLFSNIAKQFRKVYHKAEGFIEEEREFPISQVFLNATFKKFVTDNVQILEDLHADLHEDWLRLYATINVKGLHTILSVDLKLVQMELNKDMQLIVFEQISETEIIEAKFPNFMMTIGNRQRLFARAAVRLVDIHLDTWVFLLIICIKQRVVVFIKVA